MAPLRLILGATVPAASHEARVVLTDWSGTPGAYGWRDGDVHWLHVPDIAYFAFRPGSPEVTGVAERGSSLEQVLEAYSGMALPLAAHVASNLEVVHGSAVVSDGGILLFCGPSGSGKTTIAFGLSRRFCRLWADDVVALRATGSEGVVSEALPFTVNLREASQRHFEASAFSDLSVPDPFEPGSERPVRCAFVLDSVTANEAPNGGIVERLPGREALIALMTHAFCFNPEPPERLAQLVRTYLEIVAQVPVFRLGYRQAFDSLSDLLDLVEETAAELAERS